MVNNSIVMATYNGETYIKEQIDSILKNMKDNDELIISDDNSTDDTVKIIKSYKDKRIKVIKGPGLGVKQNFANAIANANGKHIFLCDQDDVWMDNKIEVVENYLEKYDVVVHDAVIVDEKLDTIEESYFNLRKSKKGRIKNIVKNTYIGCCMAFNSNLKDKILPIPNNIEMHDQWIGILGEKYGKSIFIKDKLIKYRRHEKNVSQMKHYPILKMIKNRVVFIKEYLKR